MNPTELYSMHHAFTLPVTIDLANQTEPSRPRWAPPTAKLVAEVSNQLL